LPWSLVGVADCSQWVDRRQDSKVQKKKGEQKDKIRHV
jgi:hypothetical protein